MKKKKQNRHLHSALINQAVVTIVVVVGIVAAFLSQRNLACQEFYRRDSVVSTVSADIFTEVARSGDEHEEGLSGRACIGANQGMLFVFGQPGDYKFWMKDMKFPIDMVWLSVDKKVVAIHPKVSPKTFPKKFGSPVPAQYILELKAGQTQKLGIVPGSILSF